MRTVPATTIKGKYILLEPVEPVGKLTVSLVFSSLSVVTGCVDKEVSETLLFFVIY